MSHTPVRCEHDSIKWFPRGTVEKYSPDQSAFAEARLAEQLSWRRRPLVARFGLDRLLLGRPVVVARLHGDWLRDLFPAGPELGYGYTVGNSLVNGGLDALTGLLTGTGSKQALTGGATPQVVCGVGSGTNATTATMTALQLDGTAANGSTGAFYQSMDANYPAVDGTVHGQLDGQATVTGSNGNLNWQEWCWASSTVAVGATTGATLANVPATGTKVMFNRWTGTSLGTKGSGATWVFSTTITFS